MNGIPPNVNWSLLVGQCVEQICIGQYQVCISFGDTTLTMECKFDIVTSDDIVHGSASTPISSTQLIQFLGKKIIVAKDISASTLGIWFENNLHLLVHDSNDSFESFQITGGSLSVVV